MSRLRRPLAAAFALLGAAAVAKDYQAPRHNERPAVLFGTSSDAEVAARADAGSQIEQDRTPAEALDAHRKLERALLALTPQRPGVVDAYVIAIALDSDPVFGREAREAGAVLARRYGAQGHVIVLAGSDGSAPSALPMGSPASLSIALARIAELMDRKQDALILYTTSHGSPFGLVYHDGDSGIGAVSPKRLAGMLDGLGIRNRLLILSACYSGVFVPRLRADSTAIVTAAAADRTSFGCAAENDWTFFGDAMINHALRKPQKLADAFRETEGLVAGWEAAQGATPSRPQLRIGEAMGWLDQLEKRIPAAATAPVGRPAFDPAEAETGKNKARD